MALLSRLAMLGGAAAGAAYFLKKRQQGSVSESAFSGGDATVGATHSGGAESTSAAPGTDAGEAATTTGADVPVQMADAAAGGEVDPDAAGAVTDATGGASEGEGEGGGASSQATKIGAAIPDMSAGDPLVREQENAAAAEAGSIGGEPETTQSQEGIGLAGDDPAMRPVQEGSGEEPETLEDVDRDLGIGREREA